MAVLTVIPVTYEVIRLLDTAGLYTDRAAISGWRKHETRYQIHIDEVRVIT